VLEELRVRRFVNEHPGENLLQSGMEVGDTWVKVTRIVYNNNNNLGVVVLKSKKLHYFCIPRQYCSRISPLLLLSSHAIFLINF